MKQSDSKNARKSSVSSFLRSSGAVWLLEILALIAIGLAVYNDWDAPLRNRILPTTSGLERYPEVYESHVAFMKQLAFFFYAGPTLIAALLIAEHRNRRELRERIATLANQEKPMPAEEFLEMRKELVASKMLSDSEFTGVYVLHNISKGKYYVGQSIRVLSRLYQHLSGHGNGDVYADFKYGDTFTVSTIPMQGSGYQSLNDLERDTITAFDAKNNGYNMTRGNQR